MDDVVGGPNEIGGPLNFSIKQVWYNNSQQVVTLHFKIAFGENSSFCHFFILKQRKLIVKANVREIQSVIYKKVIPKSI